MCKITKNIPSTQEKNKIFNFECSKRSVECSFTAPDLSSNGGLLLMKAMAEKSGLLSKLASCIEEWRDKRYIKHSIQEQIEQRVMQIIAGYEDADDCDSLRNDSILKMSSGIHPSDGALSSQPTMSRLENKVSHKELYAIGEMFIEHYLDSYDKVPFSIIIDLDDANANTHGAQQLTFYNAYYGEYCYMPLLVFDGATGKLITPMLRPGRVCKRTNVSGFLIRLITRIRKRWPKVLITVRGDAMFSCSEFMNWSAKQKDIHFVTGLSGNAKLYNMVQSLVREVSAEFAETRKPVKKYKRFLYQAGSWNQPWWVVAKVEYTEAELLNIRFVVTSRISPTPQQLYEWYYCKRGNCELYIKELKTYMYADRMSCSSFSANQFRLFLHAAAYVLVLEAKEHLFGMTDIADVSIMTFREKIILSAVRITELKTKTKVEFSKDHPKRAELAEAFSIIQMWQRQSA